MDCMAAAKFAYHGESSGFITAGLESLNSLWAEFRGAYLQAITKKETIEFSYQVVQMKYMKITGGLNDLKFVEKNVRRDLRMRNSLYQN